MKAVLTTHRLFGLGIGGGLLHALDDAVLHRQAGVPWHQHLAAFVVVTVAGVLAVVPFPRLRAGLQSVVCVTAAALAGTNGAMHLLHVLTGDGGRGSAAGARAGRRRPGADPHVPQAGV